MKINRISNHSNLILIDRKIINIQILCQVSHQRFISILPYLFLNRNSFCIVESNSFLTNLPNFLYLVSLLFDPLIHASFQVILSIFGYQLSLIHIFSYLSSTSRLEKLIYALVFIILHEDHRFYLLN